MSRVILLALSEADVRAHCARSAVGVSSIEGLMGGGVRLVCQSGAGADTMRQKLQADVIRGDVVRERVRPSRPRI
jgi:hypothetical protein